MRFALGLAVPAATLALFVGIMTGQSWAVLPVLAATALVAVCVLIALLVARLTGMRVPSFHAHGTGTKRRTVWHERDGHAKMLDHLGIGSTWDVWREDGGWAGITEPLDEAELAKLTPAELVAVFAAGGIAAGTQYGCGADNEGIEWAAKRGGWFGRGRAKREGKRLANKVVG